MKQFSIFVVLFLLMSACMYFCIYVCTYIVHYLCPLSFTWNRNFLSLLINPKVCWGHVLFHNISCRYSSKLILATYSYSVATVPHNISTTAANNAKKHDIMSFIQGPGVTRIGSLGFQAGCHISRQNLG